MSKCQAPSLCGRKAYNLFLLKKYFPVPEFAVINTKAFTDYRKCQKITPALEDELKEALKYFLKKGPVAIRSSSTTEDQQGTSFAGMYTTKLNVENIDSGIEAVIRVWRSIDSPRVKNYREQINVSPGSMAVIIQHQLKPEVSGVMVTQSPFSVSEILIECCRGLGEKLVSGQITPTRYRLKGYNIIERKDKDLLSKNQLLELVKAGKKIEKFFKSPQDIEWAIEDGKLYILQSRPTLVHASVPRRQCTVWCNANVRETIPDPISPLCWSIFDDVLFPSLLKGAFGIPINQQQYEKFRPVELLSGRLYWNINNTIAYGKAIGPILDLLEGSESLDPVMATAFKAVDIDNLPKPMSAFTMLRFTAVSLVRLTYYMVLSFFRYRWLSKKITKTYKESDALYTQFKPVDDLVRGLRNTKNWLELVLGRFTRRYFGGVFLSIFHLIFLSRLLRIKLGKRGEVIARKTIIGILDKTGEMVIALNNLAVFAKKKIGKFTHRNLKKLYANDINFHNLFNKFLDDFGHRGPAEFDIASPNWREDHKMVYQLIQIARDSEEYNIDREAILHDLLQASRPFERFILKIFIPRIEVFTPLRENGKHIYLKAAAKVKDQLLIMEKILLRRGYVRQNRDIFFLTLEDLEYIAENQSKRENILKLIKTRKREWQMYRQREAPDIIYESGERITTALKSLKVLLGESLSFGKIKARTRIIKNFDESYKLRAGEILVTHHTDPGWTPLFTTCSGVIIEVGGLICHAAMVARELGIPAVVIKGATSLIPDGTMVELDADEGRVRLCNSK